MFTLASFMRSSEGLEQVPGQTQKGEPELSFSRLPKKRAASAAGDLHDFGREVVLDLLDAFAERIADERVNLHVAAELLAELGAELLDRAARLHHALLAEERDFREPLVD